MKFSKKLILIKNVSFSQLTEFGARVPYEFFFKNRKRYERCENSFNIVQHKSPNQNQLFFIVALPSQKTVFKTFFSKNIAIDAV